MDEKQKAIFKQLQIAGLGLVLVVFGIFYKEKAISIVGVCVFLFGIFRTLFIKKMIDKIDD